MRDAFIEIRQLANQLPRSPQKAAILAAVKKGLKALGVREKSLREPSNWGKKIDFGIRYAMYSTLIEELRTTYNFDRLALCKETIEIWNALKMDYREIGCNCGW